MSADTHPEIERLQIKRWRHRHSAGTPAQLQRLLADLLLGPELASRYKGQLQEKA